MRCHLDGSRPVTDWCYKAYARLQARHVDIGNKHIDYHDFMIAIARREQPQGRETQPPPKPRPPAQKRCFVFHHNDDNRTGTRVGRQSDNQASSRLAPKKFHDIGYMNDVRSVARFLEVPGPTQKVWGHQIVCWANAHQM
jgi:hypothetical protein